MKIEVTRCRTAPDGWIENENELVAVNVGNGMDVCFVPEHITGLQRAPLEAELEDVQALKR